MGWTISCGAEIAHNVSGAPDDANYIVHGLHHLNTDEKLFRDKLINKVADYDPTDGSHYEDSLSWQSVEGKRYIEGKTDVSNDTYSLYGLGLNADFAFTPDNKIVVSSEKPIKIERTNIAPDIEDGGCDAYSFRVINSSDLTYIFTSQDRSRYDYQYGSPLLDRISDSLYYASAWHLDEIKDINGNNIKYKYHKLNKFVYKTTFGQSKQYISSNENGQTETHDIYSSKDIVHHPQVLDEIITPGVSIKLHYTVEDFNSTYVPLIGQIEILSVDGNKRIIKFIYENKDYPFLKEIIDQDEVVYSFEYNNKSSCYRYNDSQDFGGYNNDIDNDGKTVPPYEHFGGTADRSIVPEAAQKSILTKIIYPTGGYTQLNWENNVMSHVGRAKFQGKINQGEVVKETKTDTLRMCMDENYKRPKISGWSFVSGDDVMLDLSKYFLMNPANLMTTDYEYSHESVKENYNPANPYNYPHIRFVDKSHAGLKVDLVYFLDKETIEQGPSPIQLTSFLNPGTEYDIELLNPLSVNGAEDLLEANMRFHDSMAGRIFINKISYDSNTPGGGQNYWPGVRIKSIVSSTGNANDEPLRKYYFYNISRDPNKTIGTVSHLPEYHSMFYRMFPSTEKLGYEGCEVNCIGDAAFPGTSSGNSSAIEYPQVTAILSKEDVLEIRGDENGKKLLEELSIKTEALGFKTEFSLAQTGIEGEKGKNFLSTSHDQSEDQSCGYMFSYQLSYSYNIRTLIHNHPGGTSASGEDLHYMSIVKENLRAKGLNIPNFLIYNVPLKQYDPF